MRTNYKRIQNVAFILMAVILAACSSVPDAEIGAQAQRPGQELFEYRITDGGDLAELEGGEFSIRTRDFFQGDVTKQDVQLGITLIENGTRFSVNEALGSSFISSNRFGGLLGSGDSNFFRSYAPRDAVFRSDGSILLDVERRTNNNGNRSSRDAQVVLEPITRPEGNILERSPQLVTFAFSADGSDDGTPVSGQLILSANPEGDFVAGALQINEDERLDGKRLGGQTRLALRGDNDPDTYEAELEFGTLGSLTGDFGRTLFTGRASLDEGDPDSILDDTYTGTFELDGRRVNWRAVPDFRDLRPPEVDPAGSARFTLTTTVSERGTASANLEVFTSGELFVPQFRVDDIVADAVDGVLDRSDCRVCERPADLVVGSDGQALLTILTGAGNVRLQATGTLNPDGSVTGAFVIEEDGAEGTFTATPQ